MCISIVKDCCRELNLTQDQTDVVVADAEDMASLVDVSTKKQIMEVVEVYKMDFANGRPVKKASDEWTEEENVLWRASKEKTRQQKLERVKNGIRKKKL